MSALRIRPSSVVVCLGLVACGGDDSVIYAPAVPDAAVDGAADSGSTDSGLDAGTAADRTDAAFE
jgi:hypothetical protein